jgi:hypothetical protein
MWVLGILQTFLVMFSLCLKISLQNLEGEKLGRHQLPQNMTEDHMTAGDLGTLQLIWTEVENILYRDNY